MKWFYIPIVILPFCMGPGCPQPGDPCERNLDCGLGQYCDRPDGECNGEGACETRPQACTLEWDPVCGCDGRTYGNACSAAGAGINIAHRGECTSD